MQQILKWIIGYGVVWVVSIPINGLLLSVLWSWFIAPILGTREISISEGIGLSIFLGVIGSAISETKIDFGNETDPSLIAARGLGKAIGIGVLSPIFTIAWAWVWHVLFTAPISN